MKINIYIKLKKKSGYFLKALLLGRVFKDIEIDCKLVNINRKLKNIKYEAYDYVISDDVEELSKLSIDPDNMWLVGDDVDAKNIIPYPFSGLGVKKSIVSSITNISGKKHQNREETIEKLFDILPKEIDDPVQSMTKAEIFKQLKINQSELSTLISMLTRYLKVEQRDRWRLIKKRKNKQKAYKLELR